MARGFSIYAPVVGVILASVALMIMTALINGEAHRLEYLRLLRRSYAYVLPVQTMRYDGLLSFAVSAKIWLQDTPITPDFKLDAGSLIRTFTQAFSTAIGGGVAAVTVNWPEGAADIGVDEEEDYVVITVAPRGVGPTYTLELSGDASESVTVPIFDGNTRIYIPFPLGRVRRIAKDVNEQLSQYDQGIAYGACRAEEGRLTRESKEELVEALRNLLGSALGNAREWNVILGTEWASEVVCVEGIKYRDYIVYVEGSEMSPPCQRVRSVDIAGILEGSVPTRFRVRARIPVPSDFRAPDLDEIKRKDWQEVCCRRDAQGNQTCVRRCKHLCSGKTCYAIPRTDGVWIREDGEGCHPPAGQGH